MTGLRDERDARHHAFALPVRIASPPRDRHLHEHPVVGIRQGKAQWPREDRLRGVTLGHPLPTVAVGEGREGLTPKRVLMQELPADDPVLGLVDDDCFIDTSCREVKPGGSAERPEGKAVIRTMDGRCARFNTPGCSGTSSCATPNSPATAHSGTVP